MSNPFKKLAIFSTVVWLLVFALLPLILMLITSLLTRDEQNLLRFPFTLSSYQQLFDPLILSVFIKSILMAGCCSFFCLLIAYPFSYFLVRIDKQYQSWLLLLVIIPFWTSALIRTYALLALFKTKGVINFLLYKLGIIVTPIPFLYTNTAVMIGLIYNLLPFMILPLYANIERLDKDCLEAARDLGASNIILFFKIILPLTKPGIIAGCILVFLPAMTLFYIPDVLGGAQSFLLGNLIQNQFLTMRDWPLGSATSVILTTLLIILLLLYWLNSKQNERQALL